ISPDLPASRRLSCNCSVFPSKEGRPPPACVPCASPRLRLARSSRNFRFSARAPRARRRSPRRWRGSRRWWAKDGGGSPSHPTPTARSPRKWPGSRRRRRKRSRSRIRRKTRSRSPPAPSDPRARRKSAAIRTDSRFWSSAKARWAAGWCRAPDRGGRSRNGGPTIRSPSIRTIWRSRAASSSAPRASSNPAPGGSRPSMTERNRLDREQQGGAGFARDGRRPQAAASIDPLENVLQKRTPPEAQLGPYPADDLVATPAPRPSLSGIAAELEDESGWRLRALADRNARAEKSAAGTVAHKARRSDYVELHARSAFSFLRAASLPEDLADAAAEAGHEIFGVADVGGLYGAPRFHGAARRSGIRPLVGAEIEIEEAGLVTLLCEDRQGYKNLCRLLTLGHTGREKGECRVMLAELADLRQGLVALSAGDAKELCALAS